jgi:hypothetical protein
VIAHLLSCQHCRDLRAGLERSAQALRHTSAPLRPSFDAVRGRRRGGIPLLAMLAAGHRAHFDRRGRPGVRIVVGRRDPVRDFHRDA